LGAGYEISIMRDSTKNNVCRILHTGASRAVGSTLSIRVQHIVRPAVRCQVYTVIKEALASTAAYTL